MLVRLSDARTDLEKYQADRHAQAQAREQPKHVRSIELENLIIEADLDSNTNEFSRHGVDVEAFDNERGT